MPDFLDPESHAADEAIDTSTAEVRCSPASSPGAGSAVSTGELLAGRFSIQRELGRGGAGTVFEAFDTKVGQQVAVKVLRADHGEAAQLERLRREVRASRPGHANAVAVYDLFEDGPRRFLTMELVDGRSLKEELRTNGDLTVDRCVELGRQVAAALADLHKKGLVHRDVKPGNILLADSEVAKLCDMGLARSTMRGGTVTETEMVVGTPAYMAPEQALAGELTAASDVYALGLTLYQCLTGKVPLQEDTAVATLMLRQRSRPPRVILERDDCPVWLDRLIRRMLDPEPARRPSAAEVERALAEERVRFPFRPRRRQVVIAAVAVVMAVASVAGYRAISQRHADSVDVVGPDIVGRDRRGGELWRMTVDHQTAEVDAADLDGDGRSEFLVVGRSAESELDLPGELRTSEILILSSTGNVISNIVPEDFIENWIFGYRLEVRPILDVLDIDGDGFLEVTATCRQRHYFPTVLLVYWSRWGSWQDVLRHPGALYELTVLDDDLGPGLGFVGVNNRLGMQPVFGLIGIDAPDGRVGELRQQKNGLSAPPYSDLGVAVFERWIDYVPIEYRRSADPDLEPEITRLPGGGWYVSTGSSTFELDRFLNTVGGPNEGVDLRPNRFELFQRLYSIRPGMRTSSVPRIKDVLATIQREHGALLAEHQYEVATLITAGKALALAGDATGAAELLGPAYARLGNDDLGYLLANFQAIRGEEVSSVGTLQSLLEHGQTNRANFDAPRLLIRVAIQRRNADELKVGMSCLTSAFDLGRLRETLGNALAVNARLWWDETSDADGGVGSVDYAEEADAVACLVRWRRGSARAGDPDAMELFVENNPDFKGIGGAAKAAALLGNGRPAEAIAACDHVIAMLDGPARTEFRELQNRRLAKALRTIALLESGDRELARTEALRLSGELKPNLLPGILVAEVLAATEG
ncbi:MAG: serine/threonine-protein kinase [Thermoanaerobaculales bacterium]|jgi:serine/threonine-protein kinase|nr:serine/threonine-protein kinase [Thermoanaerobaculales bacterium]